MSSGSTDVRPRHVLSAVAAGVVSSAWAELAAVIGLIVVAKAQGLPMPPPGIDSAPGAVGSVVGAALCGLLYVTWLRWPPRSLGGRSALLVLFGTPVMAGVHLAGLATTGASLDSMIPWVVGVAVVTSALTPTMVRLTVLALARPRELAGLSLLTSLFLIGVMLIVPASDVAATTQVLAAAPLGLVVRVVLVGGLAWMSWILGVDSADSKHAWLPVVAWLGSVFAALTGALTFLTVLAG